MIVEIARKLDSKHPGFDPNQLKIETLIVTFKSQGTQ